MSSDPGLDHRQDDDRSAVDEAVEYLRSALVGGRVLSKDLERRATEASISAAALRRARRRLRVKSGNPGGGPWYVWLPAEPARPNEPPAESKPALRPGFGHPYEHQR
jgi:hypothetical protein